MIYPATNEMNPQPMNVVQAIPEVKSTSSRGLYSIEKVLILAIILSLMMLGIPYVQLIINQSVDIWKQILVSILLVIFVIFVWYQISFMMSLIGLIGMLIVMANLQIINVEFLKIEFINKSIDTLYNKINMDVTKDNDGVTAKAVDNFTLLNAVKLVSVYILTIIALYYALAIFDFTLSIFNIILIIALVAIIIFGIWYFGFNNTEEGQVAPNPLLSENKISENKIKTIVLGLKQKVMSMFEKESNNNFSLL